MRKIIKIKTDKLFTDITSQVASFSKEWGKSGLVNIFLNTRLFAFGAQKMRYYIKLT